MATLSGRITVDRISINGSIFPVIPTLTGKISTSIGSSYYPGTYVVTPTQHTQILSTANKTMRYDVTVNPIPSNYGLITWDGSELMVS